MFLNHGLFLRHEVQIRFHSGFFSMETFPLYGDFTGTLRGLFSMETFPLFPLCGDFFPLYGDFFPLYGDFTGTLLYGDVSSFSSLRRLFSSLRGLFSSLRGLYGDSSLWRLFLFFLFTGTFFLFTGTLRGLFSMETFPLFPLYGDFFPLYGDFTGTLLYGDFSSLQGLYGDSSLWRLFLFFLFTGTFFLFTGTFFLFTGTLRRLFSMQTFPLFPLYGDFFPLYGDFTGTL